MNKITGVILAGGENKRFPVIKGLVKVGEERIIEKTLRILTGVFNNVIISTNAPELYFYLSKKMIGDVYPSKGPMVGIFSSLINTLTEKIFVTACDMPFIKPELVRFISSYKDNAPVILCSFDNRVHPLLGIYDKEVLPALESYIRKGLTKLTIPVRDLNGCIIDEKEIKNIDPEGVSFVNINTPEDFKTFIRR